MNIEQGAKTLAIVTIALLNSLLILAFVATYLAEPSDSDISSMANVLLPVAALMLFGGFIAKEPYLRLTLRQMSGPRSEGEPNEADYVQKFYLAHVLSLVIREGGVILSFVLSFLSGDPSYVWGGAGLGLVMGILDFPTKTKLEAFVDKQLRLNRPL